MSSQSGRRPILIGGAPRSGTTLLMSLLGTHSQIAALYETKLIASMLDWLAGTVFNRFEPEAPWALRLSQHFSRETIYQSMGLGVSNLFDGLAREHGKRRWLEKTPQHVLHFDHLLSMFPEMRFINMIRDGRDVAVSMLKLQATPDTIGECAALWGVYVRAGRTAERRHPQHCLTVRYEDLVAMPSRTLQTVCQFIGVEFEPQLANVDETKVSLFTENWGVDAPPSSPIGRWRSVENFPKQVFLEATGELLAELGYESGSDW
jgi:hypothetical protein